MKIATLLFSYNRSIHIQKALIALKHNTVLPEKLIIFQDGLEKGDEECIDEWQEVNTIIHSVDWCDTEVIVSDCNRGLAKSIVTGIDYAFKKYDAVIVLEDDCIAAPAFVNFMIQCLNKYKENEAVYSVSGYSWPIAVKKDEFDVYGCGRVSTWGWGTWRDRWEKYNEDIDILKRLKKEKIKSRNLAVWGRDCEGMLLGKIAGDNDSWAIYWGLKVIENGGICINPYDSLIQNIGHDGSGVHCRKTNKFQVLLSKELKQNFQLPDKVVILKSTEEAFAGLYGSYTAANEANLIKEKILIYGLGNFYFQNEEEINRKYCIEAFVDKNKHGWYAGKEIIDIHRIKERKCEKILIMIQNIQECINVAKELIAYGIKADNLFFGISFYGSYAKNIDNILALPDGCLSVSIGKIIVKVRSLDEFNNIYEVLVNHIYNYFINNDKKDIIFDVGMNIGSASLFFLNCENVQKIYAFEPFKETYIAALDNLNKYMQNEDQIEAFQFGISEINEKRWINFNSDMTCGQSTIADVRKRAYEIYQSLGVIKTEKEKQELIEVRDAVEVFLPIIQKHTDCNIILKLDCEGEEYGIIEKLFNDGMLPYFTFIMLEWHYKGKDSILSKLKKSGFSFWCSDKDENVGLIYAFKETSS